METDELKNIWQTLAKEKLISNELAEENIERIIALKSSKVVSRLNKKLKTDLIINISASIFIIVATIFVPWFNNYHGRIMRIEAYIFLIITFAFFMFKSFNVYSKMRLLKFSFTTSAIKIALENVKRAFEKVSKKELIITYSSFIIIVIYANVLLNEFTDFSNYSLNTFQGYILIFSIVSLISLPFTSKYIYLKRFSGILGDIDKSLNELEEL